MLQNVYDFLWKSCQILHFWIKTPPCEEKSVNFLRSFGTKIEHWTAWTTFLYITTMELPKNPSRICYFYKFLRFYYAILARKLEWNTTWKVVRTRFQTQQRESLIPSIENHHWHPKISSENVFIFANFKGFQCTLLYRTLTPKSQIPFCYDE